MSRNLSLPFDNGMENTNNRFLRLPSLTDFDFLGIKLNLFKKYHPNKIISIQELENTRRQGYEY